MDDLLKDQKAFIVAAEAKTGLNTEPDEVDEISFKLDQRSRGMISTHRRSDSQILFWITKKLKRVTMEKRQQVFPKGPFNIL